MAGLVAIVRIAILSLAVCAYAASAYWGGGAATVTRALAVAFFVAGLAMRWVSKPFQFAAVAASFLAVLTIQGAAYSLGVAAARQTGYALGGGLAAAGVVLAAVAVWQLRTG